MWHDGVLNGFKERNNYNQINGEMWNYWFKVVYWIYRNNTF